jgi:hypothetical protein
MDTHTKLTFAEVRGEVLRVELSSGWENVLHHSCCLWPQSRAISHPPKGHDQVPWGRREVPLPRDSPPLPLYPPGGQSQADLSFCPLGDSAGIILTLVLVPKEEFYVLFTNEDPEVLSGKCVPQEARHGSTRGGCVFDPHTCVSLRTGGHSWSGLASFRKPQIRVRLWSLTTWIQILSLAPYDHGQVIPELYEGHPTTTSSCTHI